MEPAGQPAQSLSPDNPKFPQKVREILHKAQSAWLKNTEVCDVLMHYSEYNLPVARDPPHLPPGETDSTDASVSKILVNIDCDHMCPNLCCCGQGAPCSCLIDELFVSSGRMRTIGGRRQMERRSEKHMRSSRLVTAGFC